MATPAPAGLEHSHSPRPPATTPKAGAESAPDSRPSSAPPPAKVLLEIWATERGERLVSLAMEEGEVFQVEHQNSIYLARVRETYQVGPDGMIQQIGLESPSAGVFEYYGFDPPAQGRLDLSNPVGPIRLRSMSYVHHRLLAQGQSLALGDLAKPGEPLLLRLVTP